MKRTGWLIAGAVIIAAVLGWVVLRPGSGEDVAFDFVQSLPQALDKRPTAEAFEAADVTIGGQAKPAIKVTPQVGSRLVYSVTVPDNAELHVSLGLLDEATTTQGDGVLFRILITANAIQEELLNMHLDPFKNAGDRGWHDVTLDLSEYGGETIDVFYNTNSSLPARPPVSDTNGDFAVWGAPRIVRR